MTSSWASFERARRSEDFLARFAEFPHIDGALVLLKTGWDTSVL